MHVMDYLVLFVLAIWDVRCISVTTDKKSMSSSETGGRGDETDDQLDSDSFIGGKCAEDDDQAVSGGRVTAC